MAKGGGTEDGYLSASSFGSGNGDGYNNKKGFDCVTNNNDNIVQGGRGQVGPQGPEGPQGPSGITQLINGTNVYLVTDSSTEPAGESLSATALCELGDFVLNGGYSYSGSVGSTTFVSSNEPLTNPPGGGWRTDVSFTGGVSLDNSLPVHAYCFDNSP